MSLSRPSAVSRYDHTPSWSSGPLKSPEICLRLKLPSSTFSSCCGVAVGRLLTMLMMPPGPAVPYSTEDAPLSTSMRSSP
ncbi:Uncharacterised protein [Achromobacter sp. 2789STDY5608615]|nr:Uncharacterised protein [Achromobacter sp. 2789STDY5608615]